MSVGRIVYGLVAGFAATVVIVLASIFADLVAARIFSQVDWELAMASGLRTVYYTVPPSIVVGVIVCWKICTRNDSL